ncbi:4461_t:CDS:1 [Gigaspora margarita]|uniref:4461_t:CDS:1 n=1 Tax=Gigaspora margarita TaxID=4874 RepID=A0ABN7VEY4_GIGMA|nr:4461_t:CDS:1 [Gigaspora margarita]
MEDVTFDDDISPLLNKNENVKNQITNYFKEKKLDLPNFSDYEQIYASTTCKNIYNALKIKRFEKDSLMKESNLFATWIYEGLKKNSDSEKKKFPEPDKGNSLEYRHIKPLFTENDHRNMSGVIEPSLDETIRLNLHFYKGPSPESKLYKKDGLPIYNENEAKNNFKIFKADKSQKVLRVLQNQIMPLEGPFWPKDAFYMFSAWMYDGQQLGELIDYNNYKDPLDESSKEQYLSYMEPFYPKVKTNTNGSLDTDSLNFQDHVRKMFSKGHQKAMLHYGGFDLHDYDDVNSMKANIFNRLTREETNAKLMPRLNPWPKKNVDLFYFWAMQGPQSRNDGSEGAIESYKGNEEDYINMKEYYDQYHDFLENGKRK